MVARKKKTRFSAPELGRSKSRRPARVGDAIRNEIATLLARHIQDPRLYHVTITGVDVSPDLRNAKVLFSCPDDCIDDAGAGFVSAKGFIRTSVAKGMTLKYVPELSFVHDLTSIRHAEMSQLFREIEGDKQKSSE